MSMSMLPRHSVYWHVHVHLTTHANGYLCTPNFLQLDACECSCPLINECTNKFIATSFVLNSRLAPVHMLGSCSCMFTECAQYSVLECLALGSCSYMFAKCTQYSVLECLVLHIPFQSSCLSDDRVYVMSCACAVGIVSWSTYCACYWCYAREKFHTTNILLLKLAVCVLACVCVYVYQCLLLINDTFSL